METWTMVGAKRARNAERPTQPSLDLTSRAPWFYPDPNSLTVNARAEECSNLATQMTELIAKFKI